MTASTPAQLACALEQIAAARTYTLRLLSDVPADDWFRMPTPAVTHIAWQVGHLAVAQYRLGVAFLRGPTPADDAWFPQHYRPLFGRDSVPHADAASYPPPEEVLATLSTVYEHVLAEMASLTEADLAAPVLLPHQIVRTKGEALFWCSRHESIHAGQIALLRRLLGFAPQW